MGVQTMKKQSGNKVNKTKLVRELTDDELNTVAGGAGKGVAATTKTTTSKGLFEVEDYSFDIEQVLNIGSQSGGAGGGK
jgi:Type-A lantibiotic